VIPVYRERRDALVEALLANLPRGMRLRRPEHGTHLWLPLPQWLSAERVEAQARRMGVLVSPSTAFTVGSQERPGLRLSFSAEPPARLAEGARRLGKVFAAMLGQPAPLPAPVRETA
jgi:DNA-binding transcriptional MocR family regulator